MSLSPSQPCQEPFQLRRPVRVCVLMFLAFQMLGWALYLAMLPDNPKGFEWTEIGNWLLWTTAYSTAMSVLPVGGMLCAARGHAKLAGLVIGGSGLALMAWKMVLRQFVANLPGDANFFDRLKPVLTAGAWTIAVVGVAIVFVAGFGWYLHFRGPHPSEHDG